MYIHYLGYIERLQQMMLKFQAALNCFCVINVILRT